MDGGCRTQQYLPLMMAAQPEQGYFSNQDSDSNISIHPSLTVCVVVCWAIGQILTASQANSVRIWFNNWDVSGIYSRGCPNQKSCLNLPPTFQQLTTCTSRVSWVSFTTISSIGINLTTAIFRFNCSYLGRSEATSNLLISSFTLTSIDIWSGVEHFGWRWQRSLTIKRFGACDKDEYY